MVRSRDLKSFKNFLDSRDLVLNAAVFIVSLSVNRFMQRLVDVCFTSVITAVTDVQTLKYKVTETISIDIGALAIDFLNLIVILYFAYLMLKYSQRWLGWT